MERPLSFIERERAPGSEKQFFLLFGLNNKSRNKLKVLLHKSTQKEVKGNIRE
ncbi:MAG: hypothetical protein ACM3RX_09015 [Methanococcaceae archaeon]